MSSKTRRYGIVAGVLIFALAGTGFPQEPTVTLGTNLVLVDAVVFHKKTGTPVGDLKREDFLLLDNGAKQEIIHFSREELPLSVVLLLDVSGSVQPIIDEIQRAALDALGKLKPEDKVALMIFANRPKLLLELTTDRAAITERLENIWSESADVGFATFINLGIYEAARYVRRRTAPTERRAIIMVTDDIDTSWFRGGPPRDVVLRELYEGSTTLCALLVGQKVAKALKAADYGTTAAITVLNPGLGAAWILFRLMRRGWATTGLAQHYARQTGGIAVGVRHEEVGKALVELMGLLRTRYTLGYFPPAVTEGQFREIKLAVSERVKKEKGDLQVIARRGYIARPAPASR
jgi:VWFA-related protein